MYSMGFGLVAYLSIRHVIDSNRQLAKQTALSVNQILNSENTIVKQTADN
jgi:hypothetical protein